MKTLLDVNLLLACAWRQHQFHAACSTWLEHLESYTLCPITELGFLRVSISPAFGASFSDAKQLLNWFSQAPQAQKINCDLSAQALPDLLSHKETTDAYLVQLARTHQHRLATLDKALLKKTWAQGIAFHPLA